MSSRCGPNSSADPSCRSRRKRLVFAGPRHPNRSSIGSRSRAAGENHVGDIAGYFPRLQRSWSIEVALLCRTIRDGSGSIQGGSALGSLVLKLVCGISGRSRAIEVVLRQKRAWLIDCEGSIAKFVPLRKCAMGSGRAEVHADHRDQSVQNWPELWKITSMRRASAIRKAKGYRRGNVVGLAFGFLMKPKWMCCKEPPGLLVG